MWTKLIAKVWPGAVFNAPVSSETLRLVEKRLGQPLPDELESLLRHTDGVRRSDGTELVWSVERIIEDNDFFRHDERFSELYMPLEPLLFFGDADEGEQCAFVRRPERPDVFVWRHANDDRLWVADDLRDYLTRYLVGPGRAE